MEKHFIKFSVLLMAAAILSGCARKQPIWPLDEPSPRTLAAWPLGPHYMQNRYRAEQGKQLGTEHFVISEELAKKHSVSPDKNIPLLP